MHTTCISHEYHIHTTCAPRAYHMHTTWKSRVYHVYITRIPRACHVHTTCAPRAYHVHTTCMPRAYRIHTKRVPRAYRRAYTLHIRYIHETHPPHTTCTPHAHRPGRHPQVTMPQRARAGFLKIEIFCMSSSVFEREIFEIDKNTYFCRFQCFHWPCQRKQQNR